MGTPPRAPYWNTNVARHRGILRAVPQGCTRALDVGCGDGLLARRLAAVCPDVTGIDASPDMTALARAQHADAPGLDLLTGDFLTADLPEGAFGFVCSVSTVHHMDFTAALERMRALLRPGGVLAVVGLAREDGPADLAIWTACAPVVRTAKVALRARGPQGMPEADPQMSYAQVRRSAHRLLPGVRYRRHVLRRYSLTWRKPRSP
ncbi:class I SAM-dependent methyltransferase [Nocardiopsis suaedae]|uniref:Class I SAM-dependent methyltransferase n=1 Tax=Nocardiopsis suaedae TaxID=3018444 RepID=A0ABT4TPZ7_9ACTN|nr:class I SAM-dependent methyltransferase [Nocardiopsis suaedae]MDA2806755.1 class I SAM-dependent methyltransferase [Nocardiopsis suaedae]